MSSGATGEWVVTLRTVHGRPISKDEGIEWERQLSRWFKQIQRSEIQETIEWMGDRDWDCKSATELKKAIYARRKGDDRKQEELESGTNLEAFWKPLATACRTAEWDQAWEIICRPKDPQQCKKLEEFARKRGFSTDKVEWMRNAKKLLDDALAGLTRTALEPIRIINNELRKEIDELNGISDFDPECGF